jgi:hypothetical protein
MINKTREQILYIVDRNVLLVILRLADKQSEVYSVEHRVPRSVSRGWAVSDTWILGRYLGSIWVSVYNLYKELSRINTPLLHLI